MLELYGSGLLLKTLMDVVADVCGPKEANRIAYKAGEEIGARVTDKLLPETDPEKALRTLAEYVRPYLYIQVKRKKESGGVTEFEVSYPRCMIRTISRGAVPGPLCRAKAGWIESALMGMTGLQVKMETDRIQADKNICYGRIIFG
ncbi:MAG TPA: hypothetical protein ENG09_00930 [Candidatus Syntrophoarchaeum butanivorans]|uniref:Hydrocarbon binding protein (Contains V4R domain) n=1 Tax=Candidatus Syntropharchaeum butanivorans TaxID=1839936 RepID=A0A1F2P5D2_9EURY|nr:MAG: hypothetical protein SBU_001143 [Candidatus Syntrophoarchaeum butanivorans]RJS71418.1 MAG: hypothetical protein CW694_05305 [Candidatus Syntrophoarchaeum sp. WYZ-LMO15]HDM35805.1 hypothetical protein [Candidatus Syntrophoarchaeum butanivorans]HEC57251.1 hypothetical protein [Candidatus Syntrophoarchaeum butanivorans]